MFSDTLTRVLDAHSTNHQQSIINREWHEQWCQLLVQIVTVNINY
jgi:hypothetical protein